MAEIKQINVGGVNYELNSKYLQDSNGATKT